MELVSSSQIPHATSPDNDIAAAGKLSCNEHYISVALTDASLHVFSAIDGSHVLDVTDPSGQIIWAHAIVGDSVVFGSADGRLRAWSIRDQCMLLLQETQVTLKTGTHAVPEGRRNPTAIRIVCPLLSDLESPPTAVLAATVSGTVHRWTVGSDACSHDFLEGHSATVFDIKSYDHGTRFLTAAWEGTLAAWHTDAATALWKNAQDCKVYAFAIGNGRVVVGREDGKISVLRLEDGVGIVSFEAHPSLINGLIYSDGYVISTGTDGFAKTWSATSSETPLVLERRQKLYDHAVTSRCMNGPWLVTGGKDGGGAENTCGLFNSLKIFRAHGDEIGPVKEIGLPASIIWGVASLGSSRLVAMSVMRRGVPVLEIWKRL